MTHRIGLPHARFIDRLAHVGRPWPAAVRWGLTIALLIVTLGIGIAAEHAPPSPGATESLQLRLQATPPNALDADAAPRVRSESRAERRINGAAGGLLAGATALLLLHAAVTGLAHRERFHAEYALLVAAAAVALGVPAAIGASLVPGSERWLHFPPLAAIALTGAFAALATRSLYELRGTFLKTDRALLAIAALFLIVMPLPVVLPATTVTALLGAIGVLFAITALVAELQSRRRNDPGNALFLLALCCAVAALAAQAAGVRAALAPATASTLTLLATVLALSLLSVAYARRRVELLRRKAVHQDEALIATEHLVETLQESQRVSAQMAIQRARELDAANTRLQESENRFQQHAHHDVLTGLANKLLLADRITQCIARSKRHNCRMAVVMVDLDDFAQINETHGETVGDMLLKLVGERLRSIVREQDTVARPGTDEFIIVLEDIFDPEDVKRVSAVVHGEFSRPFDIGDQAIRIGATVGCAIHPEDGSSAAALLTQAERAMGRAKLGKRPARGGAKVHRLHG